MDDIAVYERLVSARDVFDLLVREYDRQGNHNSFENCKRAALAALLDRLKGGYLDAWSTTSDINSSIDTGTISEGEIVSTWDFHHHSGFPEKLPVEFWAHFFNADDDSRSFDPITGDFRFGYLDFEYSSRTGIAFDVWFDPRGLPSCSVPTWPTANQLDKNTSVDPLLASRGGKGRPPANWWPAFAEELAVYINDYGFPAGVGQEGQSKIIDDLFARLSQRGIAEPGRTSVQPVVRAVLSRIRPAGK